MVKFRTMTDARDASGALLPDAERLTSFGKFLRRSSLDELPELWNVLRGEMRLLLAVHTERGYEGNALVIRLISCRRATSRERRVYEEYEI